MTREEVSEVVQTTLSYLLRQKMLKKPDEIVYRMISERLFQHWMPATNPDLKLERILKELDADPYIFAVLLFYRDRCTVETIAERMGVDVRTVSRNKKRLCIEIYRRLETT
ncbi:MAG: hypothetical protein J6S92_13655 [Oscillospiraceae bacterium]|nr:hypothetical protein [Bacteroidaceae bacterium]MBP0975268.1 hypothetical protein [Oscillospiraceae bacterium]MBP0989304.1 hypothetical protein [Oscillospiraceae bacterium]